MNKKTNAQAGFTLVEMLVVVVLIVLVVGGIGLIFVQKSKTVEDNELAMTAHAAAENGLEILINLSKQELENMQTDPSFASAADNEIDILNSCNVGNCDWIVVPGQTNDSPAQGLIFRQNPPDGKVLLLRRWRVDNIDANLGLKKITIVILKDQETVRPIASYSTIIAKN